MIESRVVTTHQEIADHCAAIAKLFKPGALVTVIVRNPGSDRTPHSAAMLVGDDSIDSVCEAALCLKEREERKIP